MKEKILSAAVILALVISLAAAVFAQGEPAYYMVGRQENMEELVTTKPALGGQPIRPIEEGDSETSLMDIETDTYGDLTYINEFDEITIYSCNKFATAIEIPEQIEGVNVTGIWKQAFYQCKDLTKVTIPDGVKIIGDEAFKECESLTSIIIPDSVTEMGFNMFLGCNSLTDVTLSNGLTDISEGVFEGCTGLTDIILPEGIESVYSKAFYDCSGLKNIVFPACMNYIGMNAFSNCSSLTGIIFSDGITSIDSEAFRNCSGLTSIIFPDSISKIGDRVFQGCTELTAITVPEHAINMGINVFEETKWYKNQTDGPVYIGKTLYSYKGAMPDNTGLTLKDDTVSIAGGAFSKQNNLANIIFPEGLMIIGHTAFQGCSQLTNIIFPDSVTDIGYNAFYKCTNLKEIKIPSGIEYISSSIFAGCTNLENVVLPDSVVIIAGSVFSNCSSLEKINIPDNVTLIGSYAFSGCSKLTEINIPYKVTAISMTAFERCTSLANLNVDPRNEKYSSVDGNLLDKSETVFVRYAIGKKSPSYVVPHSVKSIEARAFEDSNNLSNITLPENLMRIQAYAFSSCKNLSGIVIPHSVKTIGDYAFSGCIALEEIVFPDYASIGYQAFDTTAWYEHYPEGVVYAGKTVYKYKGNMMEDTTIKLRDDTLRIRANAFSDCFMLAAIALPESLEVIEENAFEGCDGLTDVYYSGAEEQWNEISVGSYNSELLSAKIHYYSVLPKQDYEYEINELKVTGQQIVMNIKNKQETAGKPVVAVALFDAENRFMGVVTKTISIESGQAQEIFVDMGTDESAKVKVFVWDGIGTMNPMSKKTEKEL